MNSSSMVAAADPGFVWRALSSGEELVWLAERLGAEAPAFFECPLILPLVLRLQGRLDVDALSRSLNEIVRRHEVLRSVFQQSENGPVRTIMPATERPLPVADLRDTASPEREAQALRMFHAELEAGFGADEPPLWRPRLYSLGADDYLLGILIHHIVYDGWSRRVLARELETLYDGYAVGATPTLAPMSVRYADYIVWQHNAVPAVRRRQIEEYWAGQLHDAPRIDLADRTTNSRSTAADSLQFLIAPPETARLRLMARRHNVTVATVLLAVFACMLRELTGGGDIILGMPVSDRRRVQFEALVGLFVNALVLRLNIGEARTFAEVLTEVEQQVERALVHQDLHYAHLVLAHGGIRRAPFKVMFNFIPRLPGAEFRLRELAVTACKVPLVVQSIADFSLHISDHRTELAGAIVYKRESFTARRIEGLASRFLTLLSIAIEAGA